MALTLIGEFFAKLDHEITVIEVINSSDINFFISTPLYTFI